MSDLTKEQAAAVETTAPRAAVIACPGSGKTRVIVERAKRVAADGVLVLTLTNAARDEIRSRHAWPASVTVTTFHSFAYGIICENAKSLGYHAPPSIISDDEASELMKAVRASLRCAAPMDTIRRAHESRGPIDGRGVWDVVVEYRSRLKELGIADFEFTVILAQQALAFCGAEIRTQFRHVLIDEAQDADRRLWRFMEALAPESIFAVGDPRQAIFGFRGGDSAAFEAFAENAERHYLLENWRSNVAIVVAANVVARKSASSLPPMKVAGFHIAEQIELAGFRPEDPPKEKIIPKYYSIASFPHMGAGILAAAQTHMMSTLVLARNHDTLDAVAPIVERHLFPKATRAARAPRSMARRIVAAEFRVQRNPHDLYSRDVIDGYSDKVAESEFAAEREIAQAWADAGMIDEYLAMIARGEDPAALKMKRGHVHISTIHGAKGLEADQVVVLLDGLRQNAEDWKLFYVAVTRARERLILCQPVDGSYDYLVGTSSILETVENL